MKLFDLTGKIALVTGGTRGLGQGMALALAEAGADIALVQRNLTNTETRDKIHELGRKAEIIECDLSYLAEVKKVVGKTVDVFGKVDILVNNAGIQRRNPAEEFTDEDWNAVIDVNLNSVFILCREAGKAMLKSGGGKIINIASLLSFQGGITVPAYAAAKGGVAQLTKALSNEWASKGININAIAPGYMATDMNEALLANETRNRQILERIPQGRWGTPEDMKGLTIFLASDGCEYVNGQVIAVDGGWLGR